MNRQELIEALSALSRSDRVQLDELTRRVDRETREAVEEAVRIRFAPDEEMARKASYILSRIGDLAIVPLLEAENANAPLDRVWRMKGIVDAQLAVRTEIVALLEQMLNDKDFVPYPEAPGPIEEEPLVERVCDVAYILLRQLVHFGESSDEHEFNTYPYLQINFEDRDNEIDQYRKSKTWSNLLHEAGIIEEGYEE